MGIIFFRQLVVGLNNDFVGKKIVGFSIRFAGCYRITPDASCLKECLCDGES